MDRRKFLKESVQGAAAIGVIPAGVLAPRPPAISKKTNAAPTAAPPAAPVVGSNDAKAASINRGWESLEPFSAETFDFKRSVLLLSGSGDASILVSQLFIAGGHQNLNKYFHLRNKKGARKNERLQWNFRDTGTAIESVRETPKFTDSAAELERRLKMLETHKDAKYVVRASPRDLTPATLERLQKLGWQIVYSRLTDSEAELRNLICMNKSETWSAPIAAPAMSITGSLSAKDNSRIAEIFAKEQAALVQLMAKFPGVKVEVELTAALERPLETLRALSGDRPVVFGQSAHTLPRFSKS